MMLVPNWIKKTMAEVDANQKRFFDLIANALPKPSFHARVTSPSKHQKSKRGTKHFHRDPAHASRTPIPTNHQRVVAGRAKRLGISVNEYHVKFK